MNIKNIFLFLILLLLVNVVQATEVSVEVTPVQDVSLSGRPAVFDIEVRNLGPRGEVKAIVTDFNWRKESNYGFYTIDGGSTIKDTLRLSPTSNVNPGIYSVNVRFYATRDPEDYLDQAFVITVVPYKDLVFATLEHNPQGLNPNKENLVTLKLRNRYKVELTDVVFKVRSEFLNQDFVTNLEMEETKEIPFSVELGNIREGDYEVNIFGLFDNNIVANLTSTVKVASNPDIKENVRDEFSFLVKTSEVSRVNNGNTVSGEVYSRVVSSFERLFLQTSPNPRNIEKLNGAYKYTWQFSLNPNDSYVIMMKTNYGKPILYLIILALIVYLIYNRINVGLTITKKVLLLKSKEGHIVGLKVLLILKNTGQKVKSLRLSDNIPGLLELPHEYGTLKPSSTKTSVAGSTVIWDIPELLKGEERVLSYKMKSKVAGLGNVTIPRAICRFKDKAEKLYIVKSNSFNLF
ncbi:MAG: hypothetical protein QT11_C0001G0066 [archaeon GW2011_AR20]|nr:MAG: hypothetical protein QT11_C0001G0066 [archaeon GW2011_AR20]MBS3160756.1 hypothetical protein [Candidatus Woesearchaeota archaeon]